MVPSHHIDGHWVFINYLKHYYDLFNDVTLLQQDVNGLSNGYASTNFIDIASYLGHTVTIRMAHISTSKQVTITGNLYIKQQCYTNAITEQLFVYACENHIIPDMIIISQLATCHDWQ